MLLGVHQLFLFGDLHLGRLELLLGLLGLLKSVVAKAGGVTVRRLDARLPLNHHAIFFLGRGTQCLILEVVQRSSGLVFVEAKWFRPVVQLEDLVHLLRQRKLRTSLAVLEFHQVLLQLLLVEDVSRLDLSKLFLRQYHVLFWTRVAFLEGGLILIVSVDFLGTHEELRPEHDLVGVDVAHGNGLRPVGPALQLLYFLHQIAATTMTEVFDWLKDRSASGTRTDGLRPVPH